jgi:hypothetical protein
MSLQGSAFLALWNDVEAGHEHAYDAWHTLEHVPERVSVPGILSGRRYVADVRQGEAPRYFTLYELDGIDVLASAPYRRLLEHPTPWSRAMRPRLCNVLRVGCTTRSSHGRGVGGFVVALRIASPPPEDAPLQAALRAIADVQGVTAVHWGDVDRGVAGLPWDARAADGNAASAVLLIEAHDAATARLGRDAARQRLSAACPGDALPATCHALHYLHDRRLERAGSTASPPSGKMAWKRR